MMYAWATKEYLLWECSIGQIIFYHNEGIRAKNGENRKTPGLADRSTDELRKVRDDLRAMKELEDEEALKKQLARKYGAI